MSVHCQFCGDDDPPVMETVAMCSTCKHEAKTTPKKLYDAEVKIIELEKQIVLLRTALRAEHNSLCAFMDYAPRDIIWKCYDPTSATALARDLLK